MLAAFALRVEARAYVVTVGRMPTEMLSGFVLREMLGAQRAEVDERVVALAHDEDRNVGREAALRHDRELPRHVGVPRGRCPELELLGHCGRLRWLCKHRIDRGQQARANGVGVVNRGDVVVSLLGQPGPRVPRP